MLLVYNYVRCLNYNLVLMTSLFKLDHIKLSELPLYSLFFTHWDFNRIEDHFNGSVVTFKVKISSQDGIEIVELIELRDIF